MSDFCPTPGSRIGRHRPGIKRPYIPVDLSGAGLTFTSVNAAYEVIGHLVFVNGLLTFPVTGNGSNIKISLPFTVPNTQQAQVVQIAFDGSSGTAMCITPVFGDIAFNLFTGFGLSSRVINSTMSGHILSYSLWYPLT